MISPTKVPPVNQNGIPLALSYDDVLLAPSRSDVRSRADIDVSTRFTRDLRLTVPVISANMDTVTEAEMAIAMARIGGIGIVHRFLTVDDQVAQVRRVKRAEALVIADPRTVRPATPLQEARRAMRDDGVSGLVVVDQDGRVAGILTARDMLVPTGPGARVSDVMTPRERLVTGTPDTTAEEAAHLLTAARIEKLPLVDADGRLTGLITLRDMIQRAERPGATKDDAGRLAVGAAIGVRGDFIERAQALVETGADALVLDIAHGHADHALRALRRVRDALPSGARIVAGNVATPEGARDLIDAGADAIKVGVGPGSVCTTRVVAGVGVPQLSAVMDCAAVCAEADIPLIADGGIRAGGDVAKAIAAGAETVMVGNLLAGTPESPGVVVTRGGRRVKVFRGMASAGAAAARRAAENDLDEEEEEFTPVVAEGVEAVVPLRDPAPAIIHDLVGGLRSGMSYSNAHTIPEMHRVARFVRITPGGLRESHPHDVDY
ncbi:MAG: IMP dehydrogenase [Thermoleophilia bacterium]